MDGESHEVNESIYLAKAARNAGGNWWMSCPAQINGEACSRRSGTLYLPPGEQFFACRHCHDLAYPWTKKDRETEGDEMDKTEEVQLKDEEQTCPDSPRESGRTAQRPYTDTPDPAPRPLRLSPYIDHALKQLAPENTTLHEEGRVKLVSELLSKMIREDGLSEERFSEAIADVQSLAPKAFAAYAAQALRHGRFSVGSEELLIYFHLHRLGRILRLHLAEDLQATGAADLLLVDTAIAALIQTRILLSRATPLSPENATSLKEEKLFRSQAIAQQKIFLSAMEKLKPEHSRTRAKPVTNKKVS